MLAAFFFKHHISVLFEYRSIDHIEALGHKDFVDLTPTSLVFINVSLFLCILNPSLFH